MTIFEVKVYNDAIREYEIVGYFATEELANKGIENFKIQHEIHQFWMRYNTTVKNGERHIDFYIKKINVITE